MIRVGERFNSNNLFWINRDLNMGKDPIKKNNLKLRARWGLDIHDGTGSQWRHKERGSWAQVDGIAPTVENHTASSEKGRKQEQ